MPRERQRKPGRGGRVEAMRMMCHQDRIRRRIAKLRNLRDVLCHLRSTPAPRRAQDLQRRAVMIQRGRLIPQEAQATAPHELPVLEPIVNQVMVAFDHEQPMPAAPPPGHLDRTRQLSNGNINQVAGEQHQVRIQSH